MLGIQEHVRTLSQFSVISIAPHTGTLDLYLRKLSKASSRFWSFVLPVINFLIRGTVSEDVCSR